MGKHKHNLKEYEVNTLIDFFMHRISLDDRAELMREFPAIYEKLTGIEMTVSWPSGPDSEMYSRCVGPAIPTRTMPTRRKAVPALDSSQGGTVIQCFVFVPGEGQNHCTRPIGHEGEHRCAAADVDAR